MTWNLFLRRAFSHQSRIIRLNSVGKIERTVYSIKYIRSHNWSRNRGSLSFYCAASRYRPRKGYTLAIRVQHREGWLESGIHMKKKTYGVSQHHRGTTIVLPVDNNTDLRDYSADLSVERDDQDPWYERLHAVAEGPGRYPRRALRGHGRHHPEIKG